MRKIPAVLAILVVFGLSVAAIEPIAVGYFGFGVVSLLWLIASVWIVWLSVKGRDRSASRCVSLFRHACAATIICISIVTTHWPLRLAFAISRPALDATATALRNGERFDSPRWVGVFWIQEAEDGRYSDSVCLWTNPEPGGPTGLVLSPSDTYWNVWSLVRLGGHWSLYSED